MTATIEATVGLLKLPPTDMFDYNPKVQSRRLPGIKLEISPASTLGSILDQAATEFGITLNAAERRRYQLAAKPLPSVSEICACFGVGVPQSRDVFLYDHLTVLDEVGRANWRTPFGGVTYQQLTTSISAGLQPGDPRRIYLHPWPPGSGIISEGWTSFFDILGIVYEVYAAPGAIWASSELVSRIRKRLRRSKKVVEDTSQELAGRGALPEDIAALLEGRHWSAAQAARLLGVDESGARAWLELFGFHRDENGRWRRGDNLLTEIARRDSRLAITGLDELLVDENIGDNEDVLKMAEHRIAKIIHERIVYTLEHQQVPPEREVEQYEVPRWTPPE